MNSIVDSDINYFNNHQCYLTVLITKLLIQLQLLKIGRKPVVQILNTIECYKIIFNAC